MQNKYNFTNCQPIGCLTSKELIALEHKYRLLLKDSGFQDVEAWDNKPNEKVKKIKFIKGHMRVNKYKNISLTNRFSRGIELGDYVRIISLYAYHCPNVLAKYKDVLQDFSMTGNLLQSIRNTKCPHKYISIQHYIKYNLKKMIQFVKEEFEGE